MRVTSEDDIPVYRVELSDLADQDREAQFLRILNAIGPNYADEWLRGLDNAIAGLTIVPPGPNAHPIIQEEPQVIRRLLYYGPRGRRSRTSARYPVFYTIFPPDEIGVSTIRILRVFHGARSTRENHEEHEV